MNARRSTSMFDRFANTIVKRYKIILIIWAIVLIIAMPLSQKVRDVVVYEETGGLPEDMESKIASDLIEERFPTSVSNSSVIIVIQGSNVTDERTRDLMLALDDEVHSKLNYIDSYFSIYSAYDAALNYTIGLVGPSIYATEDNSSMLAQMIYASPSAYCEAYNKTYPMVNLTSSSLFGTPSAFLQCFIGINESVPNDLRSALAKDAAWDAINSTLDGTNATQVYMMRAYLDNFASAWSATFNASSPLALANDTSPIERAQRVTEVVAPSAFGFENTTNQEAIFTYTIFHSLNITTYDDARSVMVVASELANASSWQALSGMMGALVNSSTLAMMAAYQSAFHSAWIATMDDPSLLSLTPPSRAKVCVDSIAPSFFGFNASKPMQGSMAAQLSYEVWRNYSITTFTDARIAHAISMMLVQGMSRIPADFLEKIYALGRAPLNESKSALIERTIKNGTISDYPVQIPSQYLEKLVNAERDTTIISIGFTKPSDSKEIYKVVDELRRILSDLKNEIGADVKTYVTGGAALNADQEIESQKDNMLVEPTTIVLIIILISIFFLSFITPIVPLFTACIAFVIAQAIIVIVGSYVADIHYSVLTLMFTMILAAGSDYSIFIIARYREERVEGKSREDAVRVALTWAGESIATSGATVMIGLGALSLMSFQMVRTLGLCLAMGVGVALLVSLTLLPSFILLLGNKIFWPSNKKWKAGSEFAKKRKNDLDSHKGYFSRSARISIKNAKAIVVFCMMLTLPALYGILSLQTSYDFIGTMPDTESKAGLEQLSEGFGAGNVMPTYVVVELPDRIVIENGSYDREYMNALEQLCVEVENMDNIKRVSGPSRPVGFAINFSDDNEVAEYSSDIAKSIGKDNKTVMLTVVLHDEPFTRRSMDTIPALRTKLGDAMGGIAALHGAKIYIGGSTAGMKDIEDLTFREFRQIAIIVGLGIFFVLFFVLRSVMIPLRLIFTIMLSITWTLALTMLVFQIVMDMPVIWLMPLVLFVILMGLGMDYDIFLCTRIREEVLKGKTDEQAIMTAVERTGGIITICGGIMAGAFGSMMLSHMGLTQEFGFGLGFAILIDATVVRIYLVPAIMVLLKKWNWWMPFGMQRVESEEVRASKAKELKDSIPKTEKVSPEKKSISEGKTVEMTVESDVPVCGASEKKDANRQCNEK